MVATAPQEVSVEQFREGLFRLAGENQVEADQLFELFKEAVVEDITLALKAKEKGKSKEEILFNQWKRKEGRKHYKSLCKNLGTKPKDTAGHHIVSWYDDRARDARNILRRFGIEIDSEANGVYLPRFKKNIPHPDMPSAHAHSVIHTDRYYLNITTLLVDLTSGNVEKEDVEDLLGQIADELMDGSFPIYEPINV